MTDSAGGSAPGRGPLSGGVALPGRSALYSAVCALLLGACTDATPDPPASLQALAFDTVFTLGAASSADSPEPSETFDGIWDIEVDGDGHLAVLDLGGPVIHVYDAEGTHVGSIADTGLEEGQLDGPSAIAWRAPGVLTVWDPGASWVSDFTVDADGVRFSERWRAFAFGETGFCASGTRTWLSYWQDDLVVHEVGPEGISTSFGAVPAVAGGESLGPELLEIAVEELTPSALLCTSSGVLDVGFVQSGIRLHDYEGNEIWGRGFDDFRPITAYSDDGIGLGRAFDGEGSHLLRSLVPWGPDHVLVQHEVRTSEFQEEGEVEVVESRLIRLADGVEVDRTRSLPRTLASTGGRLYLVSDGAIPTVTAVTVRQASGVE